MKSPAIVIETERLILRRLCPDDSEFILQLVNEPSWLKYIGDKGVHSLGDAENYLRAGPLRMYAERGFGLYRVETRDGAQPIGICGLIKREALDDVDLGFAFLQRFWGKRYAFESASATVSYGQRALRLSRIVAVTSQDNHPSVKLLRRLGFRFERMVRLGATEEELELYASAG
ncbi:MAG: GNAT family N-acetyltransferase [Terriglobia bacterium]